MMKQPTSPTRRQILAGTGIAALVLAAFSQNQAGAATRAAADAIRNQINILRKAKRRAGRIKIAKARRATIRNYNRAIRDARKRLRQCLRELS